MREIKTEPLAILLEPSRRNTAPAITTAAMKAVEFWKRKYRSYTFNSFFRSLYWKYIYFRESIKKSIELSQDGKLIIFGIVPTYPATGYGYIKAKNN